MDDSPQENELVSPQQSIDARTIPAKPSPELNGILKAIQELQAQVTEIANRQIIQENEQDEFHTPPSKASVKSQRGTSFAGALRRNESFKPQGGTFPSSTRTSALDIEEEPTGALKATLNIHAPPFKHTLESLHPWEVHEFRKLRTHYIGDNLQAYNSGLISGLWNALSLSVRRALDTKFREVRTAAGTGPFQGRGWAFMDDDFVFAKLFEYKAPKSQDDFARALFDFIRRDPYNRRITLQHHDASYSSMHMEHLRVLDDLKLYYDELSTAVQHRTDRIHRTRHQYVIDPAVSKDEKSTVNEYILTWLVPYLGSHFRTCITDDVFKNLSVPDLLDRLMAESTAFEDNMEKVRLGLVNLLAKPLPPGQQSHSKSSGQLTRTSDKYGQYKRSSYSHPSDFSNRTRYLHAMEAEMEQQYEGALDAGDDTNLDGCADPEDPNVPMAPTMELHTDLHHISNTSAGPRHQSTTPDRRVSSQQHQNNNGVCMATVRKVLADRGFDPNKHGKHTCSPTCPWSHDPKDIIALGREICAAMSQRISQATPPTRIHGPQQNPTSQRLAHVTQTTDPRPPESVDIPVSASSNTYFFPEVADDNS